MNDLPVSRKQGIIVFSAVAVVFVLSALRFDGPARGYWDTYITVPAMFMTGQPVDLRRIDGTPRFDYTLTGRLPDDTFDPSEGGFGIASKDQRIGAAILFAAPFSLLNQAAFRMGFAVAWAGIFLFSFVVFRRLLGGFTWPLLAALLLVFNPFSLYLDRLNGNTLGLSVLVFLFFLLTSKKPHWWLIGLVYGLVGGIRNEAIILAPMFLAFLWWRRKSLGGFMKDGIVVFLTALIGILPVLLWNRFAYGQMIIHPSQVSHLQGFRPTFEHAFLGSTFQFNGLLNWPFIDRVVRTPHFAYPTFLLWPLLTIQSLGLVLAALLPFGVAHLWRRHRFLTAMLLYWYVIVYVLFFPQENWEELKQTFMALHLLPLFAFVCAGLAWLAEGWRRWTRWAAPALLIVLMTAGMLSLRQWDVPVDERWYVRFPHAGANDSGLTTLPPERRKDWHFFYTRETPDEVRREQRHMTSPRPWPQVYRPIHIPGTSVFHDIATEFQTRDLTTLAVWSYIYE